MLLCFINEYCVYSVFGCSPFWSLLLVVDGVPGDVHGVGARGLPGQRDEPRAGDDGLEAPGGAGAASEAGAAA